MGTNLWQGQLYSAASLENQATSTMTWYPTQSHYSDTERTSPCPLLIMLSVWLGSDKYQYLSHWLDQDLNPRGSDSPISQNRKWMRYSFGYPIWLWKQSTNNNNNKHNVSRFLFGRWFFGKMLSGDVGYWRRLCEQLTLEEVDWGHSRSQERTITPRVWWKQAKFKWLRLSFTYLHTLHSTSERQASSIHVVHHRYNHLCIIYRAWWLNQ